MGRTSDSLLQLSGWRARVGLLGFAGVIALVLAGGSLGAVTPHLVVTSIAVPSGQTLSIAASRQKADDAVGRVQIYVPNGFALNSPASGSVGKATAEVVRRDIDPAAEVKMTGAVSAISPASASIGYENASCDGDQHLAAWIVQLKGAKGSTLSFPIFIDAPSGTSSSFGPYVLVACFRPADIASTDPNRSTAGSVVDSFSLALSPFFRPTTDGSYRWRSVWTPFTAGTGTMNPSAAVEAQSIVTIPTGQIVIFGKKSTASAHGKKVTRVMITGQVLVGGEPDGTRPRHDSPRDEAHEARLARSHEDRNRRWLHDVRHAAQAEGVLPGEQLTSSEGSWSFRLSSVVHRSAVHRHDLRWRARDQRHDAGRALAGGDPLARRRSPGGGLAG